MVFLHFCTFFGNPTIHILYTISPCHLFEIRGRVHRQGLPLPDLRPLEGLPLQAGGRRILSWIWVKNGQNN